MHLGEFRNEKYTSTVECHRKNTNMTSINSNLSCHPFSREKFYEKKNSIVKYIVLTNFWF